jgi:type VI secretion system protein VasG
MEDAEGRYIDFRNTLILLTTNVGTDLIMSLCKDPELMPDVEGMATALRQPLLKVFPPALLGRLVAIPYYPLSDEMLGAIIRLQLDRIVRRIAEQHRATLTYDETVVGLIAQRCAEVESGARVVDAILTNTVLPAISREFLNRTLEGQGIARVQIGVGDGGFSYGFE